MMSRLKFINIFENWEETQNFQLNSVMSKVNPFYSISTRLATEL